MLTPDAFRALARSSPWRCSTAHFTHRGDGTGEVEAWLERPGTVTVRDEHGTHRWVDDPGNRGQVVVVRAYEEMPGRYPDDDPVAADLHPPAVRARDLTPITRDDGLVLVRPDDESWPGAWQPYFDPDDPMYGNYRWVAMLDPRELARGVEVSDVREVRHHGRTAWAARCVPIEGYDPRCGCCELLWSEVSVRAEVEAGGPEPRPGTVFPEAYDVVLDHATGFVVHLVPVGESSRDDLELDVQIHSAS
ncbi:hypothetical protein [Nocardioides daphniae]|uniref:hypothetical protein n=1 Tax=Nocardioides daphniae TaxID=402297 RepID=UPI0016660734|nr:hypothetical protein [Nocardioides daphniae]